MVVDDTTRMKVRWKTGSQVKRAREKMLPNARASEFVIKACEVKEAIENLNLHKIDGVLVCLRITL